jgi:hypothetical protein
MNRPPILPVAARGKARDDDACVPPGARKSETPGGQPKRPRISSGRRRANVPGLTLHLMRRLESSGPSYHL